MSIFDPRNADGFLAPLQIYMGRLLAWLKGRATSYGLAFVLVGVGILFIVIAAAIGTTAFFHWIELHYGVWTAYGAVGGIFAFVGVAILLCATVLLKRPTPPLPVPPSATNILRNVAMPMASRVASRTVKSGRADGTTRLLAAGAALLVVGWAVTSWAGRQSSSEGPTA